MPRHTGPLLASIGFISAIALLVATLSSLLSIPIRHLSTGPMLFATLWLTLGFWFSTRGALTSENNTVRQLGRFGLYIHGIVMFATAAGFADRLV